MWIYCKTVNSYFSNPKPGVVTCTKVLEPSSKNFPPKIPLVFWTVWVLLWRNSPDGGLVLLGEAQHSVAVGGNGEAKGKGRLGREKFSVVLNLLSQLGFLQSWWSEREQTVCSSCPVSKSPHLHHRLCFDFFFFSLFYTWGALKL